MSRYSLDEENQRSYAARAKEWRGKAGMYEQAVKSFGTVEKSGGSGIIESGSEAMYRKKNPDKIEPMPKKQFHKIEKAFKRLGGIFQYDELTSAYLDSKHAEAITYDSRTVLLKPDPSRASVFEELIHTYQYRTGKNDGSYLSRVNCEIEAQKSCYKTAEPINLPKKK